LVTATACAGFLIASGACVREGRAADVAPGFAGDYTITDLGTPTGVPGLLGGLTLMAGTTDTLLVGGNANGAAGAIYSIGLVRDAGGHITGFSSPATLFSTAPYIDGGLAYGPGGVLFYTGFPTNQVGQIKPGSSTPDKVIDLGATVGSSVGALNFVPDYAPGAGGFKIVSYNTGGFYSATLTADGSGTYDITSTTLETPGLSGGPEGFVYVPPGSPVFGDAPTMLVSEYIAGNIAAYDVDSSGNPILGTRRDFITGLTGAEGAFIDPVTGDFLFSTFGGGNRIIVVRGFAAPPGVPEPAGLAMMGIGLVAVAGLVVRRRRASA
jgi:hypothetical protein